MRKSLPYVVILSLTIFLAFLFGVKHGREVERLDKYFYFTLSLTPKQKPSPTTNPYSFKLLQFKECKTSFVYPETLNASKNKQTLKLIDSKKILVEISCSAEKPKELDLGKKIELKFKNNKIKAFEENGFFVINYFSEINSLYYTIKTVPELYPLVANSINFEK